MIVLFFASECRITCFLDGIVLDLEVKGAVRWGLSDGGCPTTVHTILLPLQHSGSPSISSIVTMSPERLAIDEAV